VSAAAARRRLWRTVLTLTGGFTAIGTLPPGGCVIVANHSSHADTAALLAAVDARHAPRFAAAADYWFGTGWRAALCRSLAAAFPVRRTGGGSADLTDAAALLRAGHAVVVYPEGTRGDGEPGPFHAGAFRLAAAAGVPVVPVGIVGTARLLPKHGRLRRGPVEVRIGGPVGTDPEAARTEVARLLEEEVRR
jgi:1-acyl-sn-glycerol-3-phosphate acyltransferase